MKILQISFRQMAAAGALACFGLLAFAYYLQYGEGQDPCPLCIVQRGFFFLVMVVLAVGALHDPGRAGRVVYGALAFLAAAGGLSVAGRQVWLQHLPKAEVPACGPDLQYMLDNLPVGRTLQLLFRGSGQCAEVHWRFLGLSIAEWSLVWFVILAVLAVALAARKPTA